ncbi:hypothetical protein [Microvirga arabica]|uniref:hypothetical protein n=1 Tax=Microvirga arabica TaxID=1128671 RepID=UPI00193AC35A|nr:hypothetical protein [Microvirga arabica]MBM1170095.1 hypothetical protein [Microvirga arabica]
MRTLKKIIAAVLAAMSAGAWKLVNGAWEFVRGVMGAPPVVDPADAPVTHAEAAAEAILAADEQAKRKPGHDGMVRRFPLGYAVAMSARGVNEHLADVPEPVAAWALALTPGEKAAVARFRPDEIEAHLNCERNLPGVPAYGQSLEQAVAMLSRNVEEARKDCEVEIVEPLYRTPRFA